MSKDIIQKSIECLAKAKLETTYEVARNIVLDYITNLQTIEQQYSAILSENAELENKLNQYENPDDLTLFYMWLDTKAKDKIKQLQEENKRLNIIINELEKWLRHKKDIYKTKTGIENNIAHSFSIVALDKLKELKENK